MSEVRLIPTAQNFIVNKFKEKNNCPPTPQQVEEWMIEFAKMHVQESLKQASEKATANAWLDDDGTYESTVHKNSILNAYPLENID